MIRIEIYQGKARGRQAWRWRAVAGNGRKLAVSSEAYTNRVDAELAIDALFGPNANIQISDS